MCKSVVDVCVCVCVCVCVICCNKVGWFAGACFFFSVLHFLVLLGCSLCA